MPIVDIEFVVRKDETLPDGLASTLADALGEVFGSEPGRLWVRVRTLPDAQYAENLGAAPRPVFVNLLLGDAAHRGLAPAPGEAGGRGGLPDLPLPCGASPRSSRGAG